MIKTAQEIIDRIASYQAKHTYYSGQVQTSGDTLKITTKSFSGGTPMAKGNAQDNLKPLKQTLERLLKDRHFHTEVRWGKTFNPDYYSMKEELASGTGSALSNDYTQNKLRVTNEVVDECVSSLTCKMSDLAEALDMGPSALREAIAVAKRKQSRAGGRSAR